MDRRDMRLFSTSGQGYPDEAGVFHHDGGPDQPAETKEDLIEIGETEPTLLQCDGVVSAAVVVRLKEKEENGESAHLITYIQPKNSMMPDVRQLPDQLKDRPPTFTVPGQFDCVDQLPRTLADQKHHLALPELSPELSPGLSIARLVGDEPNNYFEARILEIMR